MTSLHARALFAANFAASTEQTRYYLCGVYTHCVDNKRYYVGTSGHAMIKIELERNTNDDDGTFSGIVPSDAIKRTKGATVLKFADNKLITDIGTFECNLITGNPYPDYNRAIPKEDKRKATQSICLNPFLLDMIGKAYKYYRDYSSRNTFGLNIILTDDTSPVTIEQNNGFTAVLMPLRK